MSVSRTQVVKFIRKGEQGDKGATMRGPQMWEACAAGYAFQSGEAGQEWKDVVIYEDNYYSCVKPHTKAADNYPGSTADVNNHYWRLADRIEIVAAKILLAQYALVKNLGVEAIDMRDAAGNIIFQAKDGNVICNTGIFKDVEISGTLKGVSGSFRHLDCINTEGKVAGGISFGSDGNLWFSGDMYHNGYDDTKKRAYRYYTSDLFCRGQFGAYQRTVLEVRGSYGYYYTKGADEDGVYVLFTQKTAGDGTTKYYQLSLYGGGKADCAGYPVDILVFHIDSSIVYNYELLMATAQRILVVNTNNDYNNAKIFANGSLQTWNGGGIAEVVNLRKFMTPAPGDTLLGKGLIITYFRDNDW